MLVAIVVAVVAAVVAAVIVCLDYLSCCCCHCLHVVAVAPDIAAVVVAAVVAAAVVAAAVVAAVIAADVVAAAVVAAVVAAASCLNLRCRSRCCWATKVITYAASGCVAVASRDIDEGEELTLCLAAWRFNETLRQRELLAAGGVELLMTTINCSSNKHNNKTIKKVVFVFLLLWP